MGYHRRLWKRLEKGPNFFFWLTRKTLPDFARQGNLSRGSNRSITTTLGKSRFHRFSHKRESSCYSNISFLLGRDLFTSPFKQVLGGPKNLSCYLRLSFETHQIRFRPYYLWLRFKQFFDSFVIFFYFFK